MSSSYIERLDRCYKELKTKGATLLTNTPPNKIESLFAYVFDREGVEGLPLFINACIYRLNRNCLIDCSDRWRLLLQEKLS